MYKDIVNIFLTSDRFLRNFSAYMQKLLALYESSSSPFERAEYETEIGRVYDEILMLSQSMELIEELLYAGGNN